MRAFRRAVKTASFIGKCRVCRLTDVAENAFTELNIRICGKIYWYEFDARILRVERAAMTLERSIDVWRSSVPSSELHRS